MHKASVSGSIIVLLAIFLVACSGPATKTVNADFITGQTRVFEIGDKEYEISLVTNGPNGAVFNINGEVTPPLKQGQTFTASDGFKITVSKLTASGATLGFEVPVDSADISKTPTVEIQGVTYNVTADFCTRESYIHFDLCGDDPCASLWGKTGYSTCRSGASYKEYTSCRGEIGTELDYFQGFCREPELDKFYCQNKYLEQCRSITTTYDGGNDKSNDSGRLVMIGALLIVAAGVVYVVGRRRK